MKGPEEIKGDKHLPRLDFDPGKFDRESFLSDARAWIDKGLFDNIRTKEDLHNLLALLMAKNYEHGEYLAPLHACEELHVKYKEMLGEIDRRISKAEGEAEGRRQGVESAANLQGILAAFARIEAQGEEVKATVGETRQGVAVLVQHLPDAKKPSHIEEAEAVAIMKAKGYNLTDRTLRNWLTAGVAGYVKYPITWDNLASIASWAAWADAYLAAEKIRIQRKNIVSDYAGRIEAEKARRRSSTAY